MIDPVQSVLNTAHDIYYGIGILFHSLLHDDLPLLLLSLLVVGTWLQPDFSQRPNCFFKLRREVSPGKYHGGRFLEFLMCIYTNERGDCSGAPRPQYVLYTRPPTTPQPERG